MAQETILATGGLGRIFLHTTNPPGVVRRRRRDGVPRRRALPEHAVRAVPSHDAVPGRRTVPAVGVAARGRREARRRGRPRVHDRLPPGRIARAARHRRARHPPDDARDRRAVRVPRHQPQAGRLGARAVPGHRGALPRDGTRPGVTAHPRRARRALLVRRDCRRPVGALEPAPPVGGRRGLVHRPARREPPGQHVAARVPGVGHAGRAAGGRARRARTTTSSPRSRRGSTKPNPWTRRSWRRTG